MFLSDQYSESVGRRSIRGEHISWIRQALFEAGHGNASTTSPDSLPMSSRRSPRSGVRVYRIRRRLGGGEHGHRLPLDGEQRPCLRLLHLALAPPFILACSLQAKDALQQVFLQAESLQRASPTTSIHQDIALPRKA